MSEHPSYHGRLSRSAAPATQRPVTSGSSDVGTPDRRYADRACCCATQPAVIAVVPQGGSRQAATDLLLCGHHYRASKAALAAAGATILNMNGDPIAADDWPGGSG